MKGSGISTAKIEALDKLLKKAQIHPGDLVERFMRSQGPGGQHVNKTSTAVQLTHTPSGLTVRVQTSRSQAINRYLARKQLAEQWLAQQMGEKTKRQQAAEKLRRQKRRRSRRSKNRMLDDKSHASEKKNLRKAPKQDL